MYLVVPQLPGQCCRSHYDIIDGHLAMHMGQSSNPCHKPARQAGQSSPRRSHPWGLRLLHACKASLAPSAGFCRMHDRCLLADLDNMILSIALKLNLTASFERERERERERLHPCSQPGQADGNSTHSYMSSWGQHVNSRHCHPTGKWKATTIAAGVADCIQHGEPCNHHGEPTTGIEHSFAMCVGYPACICAFPKVIF